MGVLRGAAIVFFAFIGFDAVSTAAQEAKKSKKRYAYWDLRFFGCMHNPLYTFLLCVNWRRSIHRIYGCGKRSFSSLCDPTSHAGYNWLATAVTVAILAGFSSVILVMLLGKAGYFIQCLTTAFYQEHSLIFIKNSERHLNPTGYCSCLLVVWLLYYPETSQVILPVSELYLHLYWFVSVFG
jgi:hypothetical protein